MSARSLEAAAAAPPPSATAAASSTMSPPGPPTTPLTRRGRRPRRRRRLFVPITLQVLAMIGIGAVLYPSAADWFAALGHNSEISGYVQSVARAAPADLAAERQLARAYNAHLPAGVLRDPFGAPGAAPDTDAYRAYSDMLRATPSGVIGELTYPRLGIGLPIYHGTGDEVLSKGIGHLYGSSLPVGGPSTHSVLTSHSGLIHASLFTPLPAARIGDVFTISALGETLYYRVDEIDTISPDDTERLQIVPGADVVTLFTCTPIGINSHRLMVSGSRIDAPDAPGTTAIPGDGLSAGFPWWALVFLAGSGAVAYLLFAPPRRRRTTRKVAA